MITEDPRLWARRALLVGKYPEIMWAGSNAAGGRAV
jgi:hypothetical protein